MEVILAKTAGFCPGVKRAVAFAYKEADELSEDSMPVYTFGPIIHNEEVIKKLSEKGVRIIDNVSELAEIEPSKIIIRSHGVGREVYDAIEKNGHVLVDATCPFVHNIHKIVDEKSREGHEIIVVGDKEHPEVCGIVGWCNKAPYVIEDEADVENLPDFGEQPVTVVWQTTFSLKKFKELVELLTKRVYNVIVCKTICNATEERQQEAKRLAADVDAMIVIGGLNSSNTRKLYDVSRQECQNTYYIQTLVDLDLAAFESVSRVGITAGASTPEYIIEEVKDSMSDLSFEQMLNEEKEVNIRTGQIVEGEVIAVKPEEIVVNINYKSDGIITRSEYSNDNSLDLTTVVKVGDSIKVKVLKTNDGEGQVALSYKKVAELQNMAALEEAFENKTVLTGKVEKALTGGLIVLSNDCRVFIPASLVSDTFEKNLEKFVGTEVEFVLTECNVAKKRIIGNRKELLVEKKAAAKAELFANIAEGQVVTGKVKNVKNFGAFVDLGGADGLIYISEMSWGRVEDPNDILKVGDEVKCVVKKIDGEKIALSLKFDEENPWNTVAEKYPVGAIVTGKVARMADFGAFVELEPGIDALLHVSQISYEHVKTPSDVYKEGDEVTAKVTDYKPEEKKISLSVKALLTPPAEKAEATEE